MGQTVEPKIIEVDYEPDCSPEQVVQVLSALDRWSSRTAPHAKQQRASERHDYRTTVIIEPQSETVVGDQRIRQVFHIPTRNISKAGLGFVAPSVFLPRQVSDSSPPVRTEIMFQVGSKVNVKLGPSSGKMPTLSAVITRLRPVQFGFFDVGVRFLATQPSDV
jgi:hypothetical protein